MKRLYGLIAAVMVAGMAFGAGMDSVVCRISGTVIGRPDCNKVIIMEQGLDPRINSVIPVPVRDGKFSYTLHGDAPRAYILFFYEDMMKGSYRFLPFISGNGDVNFVCYDREHEDSSRVTSTLPENMLAEKFNKAYETAYGAEISRLSAKIDSLFDSGAAYTPEYKSLIEKRNNMSPGAERDSMNIVISDYDRLPKERRYSNEYLECQKQEGKIVCGRDSLYRAIITVNPSVFGLNTIKQALMSKSLYQDPQDYIDIYESVYKKVMPEHPYMADIAMMIEAKKVAAGNIYPDYKITRPDGSTEMIGSLFRGNVAVIDLWASWCGPCRRHSIELIPLYEKYKDKGFKVIAVARERGDCMAMNKAMKNDCYPWESFVDLDDADNVWRINGAGNAGGKIILVGADGVIVDTDIPVAEIEKFLEKTYGK